MREILLLLTWPMLVSSFCPSVCVCKWKSGKQSVECTEKTLITIPEGIDSETQLLDMSGNNLQVLPEDTFVRAALLDLQKVYLRNCQIGQIDDRALRGLKNVVDLDLSKNLLTYVPSSIFEDVPNLRNLSLALNPIQKIDNFAFHFVSSLVKLDLSYCQLNQIASRAFEGLEYLELLRLNNNRLSDLKQKTVDVIGGLHGIELHENPWYCDCSLRSLKLWLLDKNVPYTVEPVCAGGPTRVLHKTFGELQPDDFACKPEMKIKPDNRYVESTVGDNATIVCRVESVPKSTVKWYWNGRVLANNTTLSPYQKVVVYEVGEHDKRSTLVLTNAQETDSGMFNCMAENRAGKAEANFTLRITHRLAGFAIIQSNIAGLSIALIVIIVAILTLITYLLVHIRRMPARVDIKRNLPNGDVPSSNKTITIEPIPEPDKRYHYPSGIPNNTSNPDLIVNTMEEPVRQYPAALWRDPGQLQRASSAEFTSDTTDKTPIIERAPSPAEFVGFRLPPSSQPNAKTLRVWQKGVQVLPPPVSTLKRVLRNSPDEGYQEGCGTDV